MLQSASILFMTTMAAQSIITEAKSMAAMPAMQSLLHPILTLMPEPAADRQPHATTTCIWLAAGMKAISMAVTPNRQMAQLKLTTTLCM